MKSQIQICLTLNAASINILEIYCFNFEKTPLKPKNMQNLEIGFHNAFL